MKYIGVMAEYFKPLIYSDKEEVNEPLEKPVANDKIKRNSQVFGMGDFDYGSSSAVPVNIKNEDEEFDQISRKTNNLFAIIESELAASFEEERNLKCKLNSFEKNLEKKKQLYESCYNLYNKETKHMEFITGKNELFAKNIHHYEEILQSWQILIDEFRKVPEDVTVNNGYVSI
ncbi:uncharacterized protein LOC130902235 isoform X1 [Diorhabda carinulata]|uniref:uncharacterized protein LOC130902235 isoform X1 n=1 Tax=Diorhabda carinulata TaxID=1163345 RepID=UPI0025A0C984|nr:uncharacterized protein LOC130902235 isoform X1 [Diorhabda carinulata]